MKLTMSIKNLLSASSTKKKLTFVLGEVLLKYLSRDSSILLFVLYDTFIKGLGSDQIHTYSREGIPRFTTPPPPPPPTKKKKKKKNVPQDVNFDMLDVPKKITLAKFGFLSIFVQPRDEKMSVSGMGGGDA